MKELTAIFELFEKIKFTYTYNNISAFHNKILEFNQLFQDLSSHLASLLSYPTNNYEIPACTFFHFNDDGQLSGRMLCWYESNFQKLAKFEMTIALAVKTLV